MRDTLCMTLAIGARLGPYEVVSLVGAGGMGEVYCAHDTRLGRDVALKVLPEHFADEAERLSRFEREARVLASLSHPNIAHVYGLEESGPVRALAMELVDGPTLADRLRHGPLPLDEACALARQIAEAVEAAHEAGVIHRDLKPANIKVRRDGTIKVLDFGLAKSVDRGLTPSSTSTTRADLGDDRLTQPGVVLGTASYMAPEQARGAVVDTRADIWAFGCVFYEMLTGRPLFAGETMSDQLAAVLTREITLASLPASTPASVRRLLQRCLERDPRTRLRDIGEARVVLERSEPIDRSEAGEVTSHGVRPWLAWALVTLAGAACMAAGVQWYRSAGARSDRQPAYRFQIATPTMFDLADFEVSPDGRTLAFVALVNARIPAVWIRPFDAAEASVLKGTEGAQGVFWSPDSRSVGYAVNRQLYRRTIQGGASQAIASFSGQFLGAAWSRDAIVFALFPTGLMRVSADGGAPTALTRLRPADRLHGRPIFLAGGRRLLVPAHTSSGHQTCVVSLDDPTVRCADTVGAAVADLSGGRLLSIRDGSLLVEPFDAAAVKSTGEAAPILDAELHLRSAGNRTPVSYSPGGVLAFRPGAAEQRRLVWFERSGRRGETVAAGSYESFDLGPDGTRILAAGTDASGNDIVSLIDVARGVVSRVVSGERGWANDPIWSPDGREFAYTQRTDRWRIAARVVNGGAERTLFESIDADVWVEDWSRDGRYVAVGRSRGWRRPQVLVAPVAGGPPIVVPADGEIVDEYHFSPDGRWLAYNSDASGRQEVYVTPLPSTGERWQVSSAGGVQPRWRGDGRELYYIAPDAAMMSVTIGTGPAFRASAPARLFTLPEGLGSPIVDQYAVRADGRAFLVAEPIHAQSVQPISVIVNWPPSNR
jgi:eukaryotic-like serine/threonine-protein kinase